jgi:ABC-type transport system substrate-binding protein
MPSGYWIKLTAARVRRRRAVALAGGGALAAGILAACGGYNEESWLVNMYTPGGKRAVSGQPTPKVTDLVTRARAEQDNEKRNTLLRDAQKELAVDMTNVIFPASRSASI